MGYLIGVQIPEDFQAVLTDFGKRWRLLPADAFIVLVEPRYFETGGAAGLEQKLKAYCMLQKPIAVTLASPVITQNARIELPVWSSGLIDMRSRLLALLGLSPDAAHPFRPSVIVAKAALANPIALPEVLASASGHFASSRGFTAQGAVLCRSENRSAFKIRQSFSFTG